MATDSNRSSVRHCNGEADSVQFPANRTEATLDPPSQQPEMLTFNSIDVETANADRASICCTGSGFLDKVAA